MRFVMRPSATLPSESERIAGVRPWVVQFRCSGCGRQCTEEMTGKKKDVRDYYWRPTPRCSVRQTGEYP
jgi:hypothetical protein